MDQPSHDAPAFRPWLARMAPLVFLATAACVAWRITRGVDFTDESYYAIFIDEWFKEGIARTPFLVLHQVSVLIVYPAALAYRALVGSSTGLILYLRCLYLVGSIVSALAVVRFLRQAGTGAVRWLSGALLVAFVPYGLPAPSYNTIGSQALLLACATFGSAVLADERKQRTWVLLAVSAASWALAVMAYPSLLLTLAVLFACAAFVLRPARAFTLTYLSFAVGAHVAAWGLAFGIFGYRRIVASVVYQSQVVSTFNAHDALARLAEILPRGPGFALVLLLAAGMGGVRHKLPVAVAASIDSLLFLSVLFGPPALFVASHDAVMIALLGGLTVFAGLRRGADPRTKLIAVLYAVSWAGGFGIAATATLALYKFSLGALLAAMIAVTASAELGIAKGRPRLALVPAATLLAVVLATSMQSYYGESPSANKAGRVRIAGGAFGGLAVADNDARLIHIARTALGQHERPGDTIAVLGRFPGLYLLSEARVRALSPYPLTNLAQPAARMATHAHYAIPANRPSLVLVHKVVQFPLINPFDPDFDRWYELRQSYPTPFGSLEIYRRRDS
jgi:hypothetical protein